MIESNLLADYDRATLQLWQSELCRIADRSGNMERDTAALRAVLNSMREIHGLAPVPVEVWHGDREAYLINED